MKAIILVLTVLVLGACGKGGGSAAQTRVADPGAVWPLSTALKTSTLGSVSCSTLTTGGAECYDGTNFYTLTGLPAGQLQDILVGNGISCALAEPDGAPAFCNDLNDISCTAPPTHVGTYCWDNTTYTTATIDESASLDVNPGDLSGTKGFQLGGGNEMCLAVSVFTSAGNSEGNYSVCGHNVTTGELQ